MEKKSKILLTVFIVVLFICILLIEDVIEIDKKDVHVDVFEIDDNTIIDDEIKNDTTQELQSIPEGDTIISRKTKIIYKSSNEQNIEDDEKLLIVDWLSEKKTDIFSNSYFENSKIAPGVSSEYYFVVKNEKKDDVKYDISFVEKNDSNIPIKYRLKKNNNYVVGNDTTWVDVNNLNIKDIFIDSNQNDSYTLEWQWDYIDDVNDSSDTIIAMGNSDYQLSINITARSE